MPKIRITKGTRHGGVRYSEGVQDVSPKAARDMVRYGRAVYVEEKDRKRHDDDMAPRGLTTESAGALVGKGDAAEQPEGRKPRGKK